MSEGSLIFYESFTDDSDFGNWSFSRDTPPRLNSTLQLPGDPEPGAMEYGNEGVSFAGAERIIPIGPGKKYSFKLVYRSEHSGQHNREVFVRNASGTELWSYKLQGNDRDSGEVLLTIPDEGLTPEGTASLRIYVGLRGELEPASNIAVGHIEVRDLSEPEPNEITGDLDAREGGPDTLAATGSVAISGTVTARERGGDGAQARGTAIVAGGMADAEAGQDSAALTGSAVIAASLDAREAGRDTAEAHGTVAVTGTIAVTEPRSDTAEFVEGDSGEITGTLDARESGPDSAAVAGSVGIAGAMAARESGGDGAAMRASVGVTGKIDSVEPGVDTLDVTGAVAITGTLGALDPGPDSAEVAGNITISASLHAIELGGDAAEFLEVPPPLPDVQVTVPGIWMRREAGGTWQRRTQPGIWRRVS